jgi:hypothetical protein
MDQTERKTDLNTFLGTDFSQTLEAFEVPGGSIAVVKDDSVIFAAGYGVREVGPFVALGAGLRNAGYAVRLAGYAPFAPLDEDYGLEFVPIEGNPDEVAQAFADEIFRIYARNHPIVEFLAINTNEQIE